MAQPMTALIADWKLLIPGGMARIARFADEDVKSAECLAINPNNKIPVIYDPNGPDGSPISLFESGAILLLGFTQWPCAEDGQTSGPTPVRPSSGADVNSLQDTQWRTR